MIESGLQQGSLVARLREGAGGKCYWDAQWRYRHRRWRLAAEEAPARACLAGAGRRGRLAQAAWALPGRLARRARSDLAAVAAMAEHARELRTKSKRRAAAADKYRSRAWARVARVAAGGVGSEALNDQGLRLPVARARPALQARTRVSAGRIMAAFGDRPAAEVTTADVSRFLRSLDREGLTPRNVNKHRQVLAAMFAYGCRERHLRACLRTRSTGTDKRREAPPAALDYYEVEEVEALARCCERGEHRTASSRRPAEQAAHAGGSPGRRGVPAPFLHRPSPRRGLTLRWEDVDLQTGCSSFAAGSSGEETLPKGRRHRFVPLSTPAVAALARLADRVTSPARRLRARQSLGPPTRSVRAAATLQARAAQPPACAGSLHGLRHAAGSLIARTSDPVFVRDFLGHAKLSTTDRYLSAKLRPEEFKRLDDAFSTVSSAITEQAV